MFFAGTHTTLLFKMLAPGLFQSETPARHGLYHWFQNRARHSGGKSEHTRWSPKPICGSTSCESESVDVRYSASKKWRPLSWTHSVLLVSPSPPKLNVAGWLHGRRGHVRAYDILPVNLDIGGEGGTIHHSGHRHLNIFW